MIWIVVICVVVGIIWVTIRATHAEGVGKPSAQILDIGISEASKRWPNCSISSISGAGNLYVAYNRDRIVGTTYFESGLAHEHKAYAKKGPAKGKVSLLLPQTIGEVSDVRNINGTKYVIMNVLEFPKSRTGGARAEFVFCSDDKVLAIIEPKDIWHDVYIPKASIGCTDLMIAIYLGPELHLFSEVPLRVRSVSRPGCRQTWNEAIDARGVTRPLGMAFSYLADMTDEEIKKENDEWREQFRVHNEFQRLTRGL